MDVLQIQALDLLLDDHFALWDFAATFPVFSPTAAATRLADLIELIRKDLVAVTFGRWHENETIPVPFGTAEEALRDPKAWQPTGLAPGYALELTQAGAQLLQTLGIGTDADGLAGEV